MSVDHPGVDSNRVRLNFRSMTASLVIKQIKKLPARESAKVNRFIYANHVPNATTRRALREDLCKAKRFESLDAMMADLKG